MSDDQPSTPPSPLKAAMSVVLKANNVVVAEVDDPALWNEVFSAINSGSSSLARVPAPVLRGPLLAASDPISTAAVLNTPATEPIQKFARELDVDLELLLGACDPTNTEPYLRLDLHHWEAMKKDLPQRGPKAIPPIVLASTVLCLWARHAGLGTVTQSQAQVVLGQINLRDANPGRGLKGADWLQSRQGAQIVLNPSKISKAIVVAAAFCKQDWSAWKAL
jgi:hypothetical protein